MTYERRWIVVTGLLFKLVEIHAEPIDWQLLLCITWGMRGHYLIWVLTRICGLVFVGKAGRYAIWYLRRGKSLNFKERFK